MAEDPSTSRRDMVRGMAAGGIASAMAAPAMAQTAPAAAPPLANPQDRYPKPPFQVQSQPWPGLQSKMTPVPDCGEASYKGSGRLAGRKALITGGDSGIGRAAAIAYAREGADVAINYYPSEEPDAREVAELIRQAGRKAVLIPGDIRDENFCDSMVQQAVRDLGGLDILVSNAAYQHAQTSIMDISTEQLDQTMKTNVYAMFWIVKAALPQLPPGSAIICTSSINAQTPGPQILDYACTKGAIMIFVRGLAKQVIDKGIRVNGVAPGPFWTPLQVSGGQTEEGLKTFGSATPMKRPGQPVELASVYVELAAASSSYTTGQIYGETGGVGWP
ncbi:SDR family oxidoreductase [Pseudoroseomonas ludipueritiae]|uniref:SDR family oxidoreductase n=1 Tax=Pseudoroseomonas ludipueritiae TaxID=198093 RepID=A0ABR7R8W7_9PROT|nr:SDR family oxidoreductase [Pseudoroseomonas ludipueritiae]MBC9178249.1 SDR family oxidoreductase [Pseudoroseomonas ludipueritiae]